MCGTHFVRRPQAVYQYNIRTHTCQIIKIRLNTKLVFEQKYYLLYNILIEIQLDNRKYHNFVTAENLKIVFVQTR